MAVPTQREIESAQIRREMADRALEELQAAIDVCGEGAKAYAKWTRVDKLGIEPTQVVYCCRREGGHWEPTPPDDNVRMTEAQHPGYEIKGERVFPFRYQRGFCALTEYNPDTAEKLAERRAKKAQRKLDDMKKMARSMLFPEVISEEIERLQRLAT